jgi:hypothetical protein
MSVAMSGCEVERAPAGVTCEKLRALRVGMPIEDVRRLLGSPPSDVVQDGRTAFGEKDADRAWYWHAPVRLTVHFRHDQLLAVVSWIRTWLRDIRDNDRHPTLFRLDRDGSIYEGELFTRIYCP